VFKFFSCSIAIAGYFKVVFSPPALKKMSTGGTPDPGRGDAVPSALPSEGEAGDTPDPGRGDAVPSALPSV